MYRVIPSSIVFACCAVAPGQSPGQFSWRELPRADAIAVGLVWHRGFAGDSMADVPSSSGVIAELRRARASARVPGLTASTVHVDRDVSVVIGVLPASRERDAVEFVRALLDDHAAVTDDEVALAVARAALAADYAEFTYPGDLMTRRALQVIGGAPRVARSTEIAALSCPDLLQRMRRAVPVAGAVAGTLTPALRQSLGEIGLPVIDVKPDYSTTIWGASWRGRLGSELHSRLDQPFVMAAFEAPSSGLPPFAVGVEVARTRASKRFRYGRTELMAHAPFVAWSWVDGDPCVRFFRRGREPRHLLPNEPQEADASAEAAATWTELAAFLDDLRQRPPSADELARAKQTVLAELGLVIAERPVTAAMLPGWLLVQLLGPRRGIDAAAIEAVDAAAAHTALCTAIESGNGVYHELLPLPHARRTWPRR